MKKRLRYAMPHVPLSKHRPHENQGTVYGTSNVPIMAKRIANGSRRKKIPNTSERACGGDVETSWSETEESLDETTPLVQ